MPQKPSLLYNVQTKKENTSVNYRIDSGVFAAAHEPPSFSPCRHMTSLPHCLQNRNWFLREMDLNPPDLGQQVQRRIRCRRRPKRWNVKLHSDLQDPYSPYPASPRRPAATCVLLSPLLGLRKWIIPEKMKSQILTCKQTAKNQQVAKHHP